MFFYDIAIAGNGGGSQGIFTYAYPTRLSPGTLVRVLLRRKNAIGFIVKVSTKPEFKTTEILSVSSLSIPQIQLDTYLMLRGVYPFSEQQLASLFCPSSLKEYDVNSESTTLNKVLPALNIEQETALREYRKSSGNCLLFGDTGSGKTRLYMHMIRHHLDAGEDVLLLTPEIGLSGFLFSETSKYFSDATHYHSKLTAKKRNEIWQSIRSSNGPRLVIGPRSVLGLPLKNVGLVILDESHDTSYRQENTPYLHAQNIAAVMSKVGKVRCVYGSATPSVNDYYRATETNQSILRLKKRAIKNEFKTEHRIIDVTNSTTPHILHPETVELLTATFKRGEQAMVLINKRGTARLIACDNCQHELGCPRCDHLLTYHHDQHRLRCHVCDYTTAMPTTCPKCGQAELKLRSHGAKAMHEEIKKLFPNITSHRFDTDSLKDESLDKMVDELVSGSVQCIIGTQMIAKGLDLPRLSTLVVTGAGSAGASYSSEERQFQLLYQVIGRAMRGHRSTTVAIQTHDPASKILHYATKRDYLGFYEQELAQRKKYSYPPYKYMMVIHYSRKSAEKARIAGKKLISECQEVTRGLDYIGPSPNIYERLGENYRWHIVVKSRSRANLLKLALHIGTSWKCELDPLTTP
jgi:primosomal protein N' (replication factor Y)